ncbi:MAG: hypothetical protein COB15_05980 [Flavobacteriales bacterium]|nr:MAG: hypothetical protein COB15_05980 [Flavobacteriales bacterium]
MKLLTIILFLIAFNQSNAQKDDYIISLVPNSVLESLHFSCSEVIDARHNKQNIGFVYKDFVKKQVPAQLEGEFTSHLKKTFDKLIPNKETQLVFIIRYLFIAEVTAPQTEQAFCKIEIEFAKRIDTNLISLGIFDSHIVSGSTNIKTINHSKKILKGFEECIQKFNKTNWENQEGILIEDINQKYNYDIENVPPKGIYLSYGQLARKQPLTDTSFKISSHNTTKTNQYYNIEFKNIDSKYVQYVSNDTNIYLRFNNNSIFIKSKHHGKYIYFSNKIPTNASRGHFFGYSGGLILNTERKKAIILNTKTGRVKVVGDLTLFKLLKPYPEILKKYRKSKRKLADKEKAIIELNAKF